MAGRRPARKRRIWIDLRIHRAERVGENHHDADDRQHLPSRSRGDPSFRRWPAGDQHGKDGSGSIYGFIGPNGSGKTTTMRMIVNIFHPDRGEIRLFGDGRPETSTEKTDLDRSTDSSGRTGRAKPPRCG